MSSKRTATEAASDSATKRIHSLDDDGTLIKETGATRNLNTGTNDVQNNQHDGDSMDHDGERDTNIDENSENKNNKLSNEELLRIAARVRFENEKEDNSQHIPNTLLKKITMGTWLGKSMLIDCSSSKVISKYVLLYENGLHDGIFSRVLRRLYPDGSQDCSHAKGTFDDDGMRADVRTGRIVWFLQQITPTTVTASVLSKDANQPGLLSGGVLVQTAPGFVVQTRHVTMGTIMNVEHTLLRRIDNVNTWYDSHTEVPDFDMALYRDEMDTFLTQSAPKKPSMLGHTQTQSQTTETEASVSGGEAESED